MKNTSFIRNSYDQIAVQYAERRDLASSIPYLEKLNSHLKANSLILDIGCGAGLPVNQWLVKQGHRVIGLDNSAEMLTLARKNVPEAHYEQRDMADLEEGEYSADAVVSFFAMFHVDRLIHKKLLRCIRSYTAPEGFLLITTGRTDWEGEDEFLGAQMAWSHFDKATNRGLIESYGFRIVWEDEHRGNSFGDNDWHPIFLAQTSQ